MVDNHAVFKIEKVKFAGVAALSTNRKVNLRKNVSPNPTLYNVVEKASLRRELLRFPRQPRRP